MTGIWSLKEKPYGKLKARWCARGFSETHADDTYADVLLPTTMHMLLALAALRDLRINHVDITAAFLHAVLDYPIYIEQPVVVMSCEVYCNYVSAVRRWSYTGSCAMVSRGDGALTLGDGTMDTECVSLWPNGCQ